MSKIKILEQYSVLTPKLQNVFEELKTNLNGLISKHGIKIHSLNGRVKTRAGLAQKISRPDRNYQDILEITDLIGFRVITDSEDVIENVARMIEQTFNVDFKNSTNKLFAKDQQKFGYRSLHYVCSFPLESAPAFQFEIQIRTILQHAWAEIEHDIGYKVSAELPGQFRRRFSQIASLLEVADREFVAIRADIKAYEQNLQQMSLERDEKIELDQVSLRSILDRREIAILDQITANVLKKSLSEEEFFPDYLLRFLHASGLKKVHLVLDEALRSQDQFKTFVEAYFKFSQKHWNFGESSVETIKKGYGLLFVAHLALLRSESLVIDKLNRVTQLYHEIDYPDDFEKAKSVGRDLITQLKTSNFIHDQNG